MMVWRGIDGLRLSGDHLLIDGRVVQLLGHVWHGDVLLRTVNRNRFVKTFAKTLMQILQRIFRFVFLVVEKSENERWCDGM